MNLSEEYDEEVRRLSSLLKLEPKRKITPRVDDVECPSLDGRIPSAKKGFIRMLAISSFIPVEADRVKQVHDISWAIAGVSQDLWQACREVPKGPFHDYNPYILLSLLPKNQVIKSLRSFILYLRASVYSGSLDFPSMYAFLLRSVNRRVRLTKADRAFLKYVSQNPSCSDTDVIRDLGLTRPTVSRVRRKLTTLGYLFGPQIVNLARLNLAFLVALVPNMREYRNAFWEFPFTYHQVVPTSSNVRSHVFLVFPRDGMVHLSSSLADRGIKVYRVNLQVQNLLVDPVRDVMDLMLSSYVKEPHEVLPQDDFKPVPPNALDRNDLKILNVVLAYGKPERGELYRINVDSIRYRIKKLRRMGLLTRSYTLQLPIGLEKVLMRISCPDLKDVGRLYNVLNRVSSFVILWIVREKDNSCLALAMPRVESKGDFVRALKLIYGDGLELTEDFLDIQPGWRIPIDLWIKEKSSFDWKNPLNDLLNKLDGQALNYR